MRMQGLYCACLLGMLWQCGAEAMVRGVPGPRGSTQGSWASRSSSKSSKSSSMGAASPPHPSSCSAAAAPAAVAACARAPTRAEKARMRRGRPRVMHLNSTRAATISREAMAKVPHSHAKRTIARRLQSFGGT